MRIRIVRGHCIGGGRNARPGEVLDVHPLEARRKVLMGFAVYDKGEVPVVGADPVAQTREPQAQRRRRTPRGGEGRKR